MAKKELLPKNFTEPLVITAMFVSGAAQVDLLEGDLICLSWYLDLPPVALEDGVPGEHELRLVEKIIMPRSAVPHLQLMLHHAETLEAERRTRIYVSATGGH